LFKNYFASSFPLSIHYTIKIMYHNGMEREL